MTYPSKIANAIDFFVLTAIGLLSFGYILWGRLFAELHIQLPFLDFPVFIGEIFLFICCGLSIVKFQTNPRTLNKYEYIFIGFLIFIILKALYGYVLWGPLALRNAALFYYPLFAVLGYYHFQKSFFNSEKSFMIFLLIIFSLVNKDYTQFWILTCFLLGIILAKSHPQNKVRLLMMGVLFLVMPYSKVFDTSRMMVVANFLGLLFLISMFYVIVHWPKRRKLVVVFGKKH